MGVVVVEWEKYYISHIRWYFSSSWTLVTEMWFDKFVDVCGSATPDGIEPGNSRNKSNTFLPHCSSFNWSPDLKSLFFKPSLIFVPLFFSGIWLLEITSVYQPPIMSLLTCAKANLIHCCELPVETHLLSQHLTLTDLSLKTHFLGEEQGLLSVRVCFYHLATWQLTLATRTLNACNVPQKPATILPHTTCPYLLKRGHTDTVCHFEILTTQQRAHGSLWNAAKIITTGLLVLLL